MRYEKSNSIKSGSHMTDIRDKMGPLDSSSELDQDEIMLLKKRLDFIEISNHNDTPN